MENFYFPSSIGLCGVNKDKKVIASINSRGQKRIHEKRVQNHNIFCKTPFLRGLLFLIFGMAAFVSGFDDLFNEDISLSEKEDRSRVRQIIFYSIFLGLIVVLWLLALGLLPTKLSYLILPEPTSVFLRNLIVAVFKSAILYLFFVVLRFLPYMLDLYRFNGAGNLILSGSNEKNLHQPLNFLNFVVFSFIFSLFVITLVGVNLSFGANFLINLLIFAICVSASYEILAFLQKGGKLKKLCVVTSCLVVIMPNTTHTEIARSVELELGLNLGTKENMETNEISLSLVRSEMESRLAKLPSVEESDIDWIIATVLGKNRTEIKLVRSVGVKEYSEIMKATEERAKGKPLSAIFGFVDFYGLRFSVNKKVLSPRMETELLVEEVVGLVKRTKKAKVLDIGTGSGAIAVCVASFSSADVTAVDISSAALEVAKQNAKSLGAKVNFVQSDLFSQLKKKQKYDIIVSNPPYIRSLDIEGLDGEVKNYDPRLALDGGEDGLDFYRRIIEDAPNHLNENGWLYFEIGKGQISQVKALCVKRGFKNVKGIKDYNKIYRIVKAQWKK